MAVGTNDYLASKNTSVGVSPGWNPSLAADSWVAADELCRLSRPQPPRVCDHGVNGNDIARTADGTGLSGASESVLVERSAECPSSGKQPRRTLAAFDTVLPWAGSPRGCRAFGLGVH